MPRPSAKQENWRPTVLTKAKRVLQTPTFRKAVKKLKPNQKQSPVIARAVGPRQSLKCATGFIRLLHFVRDDKVGMFVMTVILGQLSNLDTVA